MTRGPNFLAVLLSVLLTGLGGCASPLVLNPNPAVRFTEPRGAELFIQARGGTLRAVFDGRPRSAPALCPENLAQVDTTRSGASLQLVLTEFASKRGSLPVQLHGPDGRLLGRGRLCVFPLLRTPDLEVQKGYDIQVPLEVFRKTKGGRPAVTYQAYSPETADGPGWRHIAWVIWWAPDL